MKAFTFGSKLLLAQSKLGDVGSGSPIALEGSIQSEGRLAADLQNSKLSVGQRYVVLEVAKGLPGIEISVMSLPVRRF